MSLDDLYKLIGSLGFPVGVCVYLLWERRTSYRELRNAIYALKDTLEHLVDATRIEGLFRRSSDKERSPK